MRETRVNLKHLLEDIRDSYTIPLEEIIIVELIANGLDSGACRISFFTDKKNNTLTVSDNGEGMKRQGLSDYHNIAATTKTKGRGIGFAGVGAKLSLLLAEKVITETKGGYGSRCSTEWHLASDISAPWKFIPFSGKVNSSRGTAVSIFLPNFQSFLLSEDFITRIAYNHFYPLFHPQFFDLILKYIYKKPVEFFVNDNKILPVNSELFDIKDIKIKIGSRRRSLEGIGYLARAKEPNNSIFQGLGISTYGKVIKSGWEWIGLIPKENLQIGGMIEIPALAEILTTNKMDFLKDAASLKKYYIYRKAIQEAILPILEGFGEEAISQKQQRQFRKLSNEIKQALRYVLGDFPELIPLLGIRKMKKTKPGFSFSDEELPLISLGKEDSDKKEGKFVQDNKEEKSKTEEKLKSLSSDKKESKKQPTLSIDFEERTAKDALARMVESKIWINISHPAYIKAKEQGFEQYHILFCVGWTLSKFLEDERSPQEFINTFLASWGQDKKITKNLF